ncbi:MAG: ABC transporter permease [Candidatus Obscuribacterales bacterium]|nr:ABC transporter permease [Candidatus Obscuribacterales bacterium]
MFKNGANGDNARRVIEPMHGWSFLRLHELWEYRELALVLAGRDISVRYKQTIFGAAWAIIQPVALMVVFSVFFHRWAGIPSEGVPYPIFNYAAMLPWQYFSSALSNAAGGLLRNANVFTKVYFPRLILPVSSVLPPLVDLAIALLVLLLMMEIYDILPTWRLVVIPVLIVVTMINALGLGIWFSALSVEYRDISYIFPFLMQFMMFASPVVYSSKMVPWKWQPLYALNPLVGIIDGFRWCLFGHYGVPINEICISFAVGVVLLVSGIIYFQRMERTFADVV